jgi:hypothetical protein
MSKESNAQNIKTGGNIGSGTRPSTPRPVNTAPSSGNTPKKSTDK